MRRYAGDDVRQVLVIGGYEARAGCGGGRGGPIRGRPAWSSRAPPSSTPTPLGELEAADTWLERACGDYAGAGRRRLDVLNRAVAGHRVASADPWLADADPAHALVCRVGYGTGEQVADGEWEAARDLPLPGLPARPIAWCYRRRSGWPRCSAGAMLLWPAKS